MNIALLGGSGFIGRRLTKRLSLQGNCNVSTFDKEPNNDFPDRHFVGDVRSKEDLKNFLGNQNVIINLAAEHRDDVQPLSLYDEVNVEGARNICKVARERGIKKILFTSSMAVYGFAVPGTGEDGLINPFNDYGRTKYEAELVYKEWYDESPNDRTLIIIRPTVVFGEGNRGNVFNLLKQLASGNFIMIGSGDNKKSLAYVENVAAFLEFCMLNLGSGIHIYNYVDKPDLSMNELVSRVRMLLGRDDKFNIKLPYFLGYSAGKIFDLIARFSRRKFPISSIRIKKFCSNSVFSSAAAETGFIPPVRLEEGLARTIKYEFLEH